MSGMTITPRRRRMSSAAGVVGPLAASATSRARTRAALVAVQTPQAFRASILRAAHATGRQATDDAALVEICGGRVVVIEGELTNRKITHVDDLTWARDVAERAGR